MTMVDGYNESVEESRAAALEQESYTDYEGVTGKPPQTFVEPGVDTETWVLTEDPMDPQHSMSVLRSLDDLTPDVPIVPAEERLAILEEQQEAASELPEDEEDIPPAATEVPLDQLLNGAPPAPPATPPPPAQPEAGATFTATGVIDPPAAPSA